jgi:ADP-ribosylglycohydrolase
MYGNGMPFDRCGSKGLTADNSALFRMLPIAIWDAGEPLETLVQNAHQATLFTNQQVEAQVCSAIYCCMARLLLKQEKDSVIRLLHEYYLCRKMSEHDQILTKIEKYLTSGAEPHGSSEIKDALWTAISLIGQDYDDFEGIMKQALSLGEDREATASIAGSLAGLSFGVNEIPLRWIKQLELSDEAETIIHDFIRKCSKHI